MPNQLLDLIEGKVFCSKCADYVLPKYVRENSNVCRCATCLTMIRAGSAQRKYQLGFKWCTKCQDFRKSWKQRMGWCEECHTKLRMRSYTRQSKIKRELTIKRY